MQLSFIDLMGANKALLQEKRAGAFTDNMRLPIHRWFRYSAGFSAEWAESVIREFSNGRSINVLDPFCGSGTTLLAAGKVGAKSVGFETHPFVSRIASVKLDLGIDLIELEGHSSQILQRARELQVASPRTSSSLLRRCYSREALTALESLKSAYLEDIAIRPERMTCGHIWLAITSILRECSGAGTAQWQYILPNNPKARVSEPFAAFDRRIRMLLDDLFYAKMNYAASGRVVSTDARKPDHDGSFDLVLTSPPYPNNYDYADATRLEMTFWDEIGAWGDLHDSVRQFLIRSCSQHSAADRLVLEQLLGMEQLGPIRGELSEVCWALDTIRQTKGGKKTYHTMVAAYFCDLAEVFVSLRRLVTPGGRLVLMIGDSAPYGVHVPVDRWLGMLAQAAGFGPFRFEKVRDRNTKWKNRKHTVPLQEGILWVEA